MSERLVKVVRIQSHFFSFSYIKLRFKDVNLLETKAYGKYLYVNYEKAMEYISVKLFLCSQYSSSFIMILNGMI